MFRTFRTLLFIRITSGANRLIYYAQKLPFIGRRVGDGWYAHRAVKQVPAVVALILVLLWSFLSRAAYIGLFIYMPAAAYAEADSRLWFGHLFFVLSFVVAGVSNAKAMEPKRERYIAVKLMRMEASRYMKSAYGYHYINFFVCLLAAVLGFGMLAGLTPVEAVLLTVAVTLWRLLWEYIHLRLFERTGIILIRQTVLVWTVVLAGLGVAYLPLFLDWSPFLGSVALHPLVLLALSAGGLYAAIRLAIYPGYATAVHESARRDDPLLDVGRMMEEAQKADVQRDYQQMTDQPVLEKDIVSLPAGSGYNMLNRLFFRRHRKVVTRPLKLRLAILGGAGLVVLLVANWRPDLLGTLLTGRQVSSLALIFLLLSVGERICRAMFYNCDISLLRYSFFRRDALRHFGIRLRSIVGQNLLIGMVLCAVLTLALLFGDGEMGTGEGAKRLAMLWVSGLSLAVFFSVHYLFVYYIFQPYATEANTTNPFFHLVNYVVSFACGMNFFLPVPDGAFTVSVVFFTALYLLLALLLVRKYARLTFRVK